MQKRITGSINKLTFEITLNPNLFPNVIAKIKNITITTIGSLSRYIIFKFSEKLLSRTLVKTIK